MSETALHIDRSQMRYEAMIGTGGIGSGSLFLLSGNHTLGREESRGGKYLDARDYCKLHIIAHNVKMLCGAGFPVYPIGKVGEDDVGRNIFREMQGAGLEMDFVHTSRGDRTLFGFCFLYPDGTGGNLTTEESACTKVDAAFVQIATPLFAARKGKFISLSAPEVPLDARHKLLELTKKFDGFAVASFTSGEITEARDRGMLALVDLLALNVDEAGALAGMSADKTSPAKIVEVAIEKIRALNPAAWLSMTAGRNGSWCWDGHSIHHVPAFPVEVKSSAGAGDAHISAIIAGLSAGLSLHDAQVLGNLAGGVAVTSQHTIHPEMSRRKLHALAQRANISMNPAIARLLTNGSEKGI